MKVLLSKVELSQIELIILAQSHIHIKNLDCDRSTGGRSSRPMIDPPGLQFLSSVLTYVWIKKRSIVFAVYKCLYRLCGTDLLTDLVF